MDKIKHTVFLDLYNAAKKSSTDSMNSSSILTRSKRAGEALNETLGDAANAAKVAAQKAKLSFRHFEQSEEPPKIEANMTVHTVVNWLVGAFNDMLEKINEQGEILGAIVKKLGDVLD